MNEHLASIALHGTEGTPCISSEHVYFAFASGRFRYDCKTCNAKCCRGFGYLTSIQNELQQQIRLRRALPLFLERVGESEESLLHVANCAPGCFFLADDGLCEIHAVRGFDAKPQTCRLFPFNQIRRLGQYLLVMPHDSLCPLEITDRSSTSEHSDYSYLLKVMAAHGIAGQIPESAPVFGIDPRTMVHAEREIVNLSETFLDCGDYAAFAAAQLELQVASGVTVGSLRGTDTSRTWEFASALLNLKPIDHSNRDSAIAHTMIAVTPYLRAQALLRLSSSGSKSARDVSYESLPAAMLCLYWFAETARAAGMSSVTFQTIAKLGRTLGPLTELVAQLDSPMVWRGAAPIDITAFHAPQLGLCFVKLLRSLVPAQQRKRRAPLGEILLETAPKDSVMRVLFLKECAKLLHGKLVDVNHIELGAENSARTRAVGALQRWAFTNISEVVLHKACDQALARRSRARSGPPELT